LNPYAKYKENSVNTATKEELTLMLYDGCIKFMNLAKIGIEEKNIEKANDNLLKAQAIITELDITLNMDIEISKNMLNYGVGSAVKYYLDNVSTKDVSYEDVYFNEQSELALYLSIAQMLAAADESVINKYRKEFENTRVIKLLDEVLENERKKEKDKIENPDKNSKKHTPLSGRSICHLALNYIHSVVQHGFY